MAKYKVSCPKCEGTRMEQLYGPMDSRKYRLEHNDWTCEACKAEARNNVNEEAARVNATAGMPELSGSSKQVAWAEGIRAKLVQAFSGKGNQELIKSQTSAAWWIDHRSEINAVIATAQETMR